MALNCPAFERNQWCNDGECEHLHLSQSETNLRTSSEHKPLPSFLNVLDTPKLIIAAGPERSGSTWLYNAIRLLFLHSHNTLNSFWVHTITRNKLLSRMQSSKMKDHGNGHADDEKKTNMDDRERHIKRVEHVLIKTHEYPFSAKGNNKLSDILALQPMIIVTHRNLRGVIRSYRRVGWCYSLPSEYVSDHMQWKQIACLDVAFEDVTDSPKDVLKVLAKQIGLLKEEEMNSKECERWLNYVWLDLNSLKAPVNKYGPDNVSKLWPSHLGKNKHKTTQKLDDKTEQEILQKYAHFMKLYNYL